jgi:hypothetical protein
MGPSVAAPVARALRPFAGRFAAAESVATQRGPQWRAAIILQFCLTASQPYLRGNSPRTTNQKEVNGMLKYEKPSLRRVTLDSAVVVI